MSVTESATTNDTFTLRPDLHIIEGKGEFVAAGTTSLVERLPNGDIIKTPWKDPSRGDECIKDITTEAKIYQRLGEHPRLVQLRSWDPLQHTIVLEYMLNGTLKQYVEDHCDVISRQEQLRWAQQAAEGLHVLHTSGIIHCDVGPHNFLLDRALNLKIADFSGSSIDGSSATVCPGARYRFPDPEWRPNKPPTVREDMFSLGSVLYFVFTGKPPFHELGEANVENNYQAGIFPNLSGILCSDIIVTCWKGESSAQQIWEAVGRLQTLAESTTSTLPPKRLSV